MHNFNIYSTSWILFCFSLTHSIKGLHEGKLFSLGMLSCTLPTACHWHVINPNNRKENSSFLHITAAADHKKQTPEISPTHLSGDLIPKNRKGPVFCVCFIKCCLPSVALVGFRDSTAWQETRGKQSLLSSAIVFLSEFRRFISTMLVSYQHVFEPAWNVVS